MSTAGEASLPTVEAPPRVAPGRERTALLGLGLCGLSAVATIDPNFGPNFGPAVAGAIDRPAASAVGVLVSLLLPGVMLLLGLSKRFAKERAPLLLFGVPAALGLTAIARASVPLEPVVFAVFAITLLAYVASAARLCGEPLDADATAVPRTGDLVPRRLQRRLRIYRVLQLFAAFVFAVPLVVAVLGISGGAPQPLLMVSASGLLGALACRAFLVDAFERHLQRDPVLVGALSQLRRHARRGRPGRLFYLAAVIALIGMALFAARHVLGLGAPEGP